LATSHIKFLYVRFRNKKLFTGWSYCTTPNLQLGGPVDYTLSPTLWPVWLGWPC